MDRELVLVIDFGGQYKQLIARRVRENKVYCEIIPYTKSLEEIKAKNPKGIIFTGGPNSVYGENSPQIDPGIFELGVPVLGICYGAQLMSHTLGGKVSSADREYGKADVELDTNSLLFKGINEKQCWMSHTDYIEVAPEGFKTTGKTSNCPVAAIENEEKKLYGVQFHPEVEHTLFGKRLITNFLYNICNVRGDWSMTSFAEEKIKEIKELVGNKRVLLALSGGVDSSVVAVLVHKAIGKQLTCVFVDHGLLRKDEGDQVEEIFRGQFDLNLIRVNAKERFLGKLKGVSDPEKKRKIIGEEFVRVFEEESDKLGKMEFLAQGTIYADVIESGTDTSAKIKTHHNTALPEDMEFELLEPLRELFKDEVRAVGEELGIPHHLVWRQPFPGPGLGIRVLGEITEEKLHIVREADAILREEIALNGLENDIWQYFACLPGFMSVGVMGDERTYAHAVGIRAVTSSDAMTSEWARIPYDVLDKISRRIVNEVEGVNRIVYDITSKPPSTIEWE